MPIAVIILLFVFDWRLGSALYGSTCNLFFLKEDDGWRECNSYVGHMSALENMNKEAVEFVRGIPVVKVFQQTVYF